MLDRATPPWLMPATDLTAALAAGEIGAVEATRACLDRVNETEAGIGAWAHLDRESALAAAEAADARRRHGRPLGALHGVPVGLKDIFDVAGLPTGLGSPMAGDTPAAADSAVAERLREAGAVIVGKTVTSPFASGAQTTTRNPHDPGRTPGGSSSGSAAAVAAGHVPLAIGTQTNGSIIRPASYCGVVGYKPSRGLVSRHGCLKTAESLDQVGVFARTLADAALGAQALIGYDRADPATHTRPKPDLVAGLAAEVPVEPTIAWFELPYADRLDPACRAALEAVRDALGDRVETVPAPKTFADAIACHRTVHLYEYHRNMVGHPAMPESAVPADLRPFLEAGAQVDERDYREALAMLAGAEAYFSAFFNDFDAILAPAALAEAPAHGDGTGDPVCATIWTFAGLPCLSLPWLEGPAGLPLGVQLIGGAEEDDRLLRTARWLEGRLAAVGEGD